MPSAIDVGGIDRSPDIVVTLVAVPGPAGLPNVLQLVVAKLTLVPLRIQVEAIVAPTAGDPKRIAAGYAACDAGAPATFEATVTATDARLSLHALTVLPSSALTLIGSIFDEVNGARVDPTAVSARVEPVPASISAQVEILGPSSYHATLATSSPAKLDLVYRDVHGGNDTKAAASIDRFPGAMDLIFNETEISYTASGTMDRIGVALDLVRPAPARTSQLNVTLLEVPISARLQRASDTHVIFTTPGTIGTTAVRFASFEPGVTVPALPAGVGSQYMVARVDPRFSVAQVQLMGLSRADVDAADPVVVDVTHRAGPFHIDAEVTGVTEPANPVTKTRHVDVGVLDLPATAKLTYSPTSQAFSYTGSSRIGELTADVTSTIPLVDDATESHLLMRDVPTGLTGRLDSENKTFTANLTGGALSLLEMQVTSGPDVRLPDGVQGIALEDHDSSYGAFVRILGLQRAEVGWGATQLADVVHSAGPFVTTVRVDDPDTEPLSVDGEILDLPARARVAYTPGNISTLTYEGSAFIDELTFDVVKPTGLTADADEAHLVAHDLPPGVADSGSGSTPGVTLTIDKIAKHLEASTAGGALGFLEAELCSSGVCAGGSGPGAVDGITVRDLAQSYDAVARVSGLSKLTLDWAATVLVRATHTARPFEINLLEDKFAGEFGELTYQTSTVAAITDLPAEVFLTYNPLSQAVHYEGSSTIAQLLARRVIFPVVGGSQFAAHIAGRATRARLLVKSLPTGLDLTFDFGGVGGDKLVIDTGGFTIGRVEMELLSDINLLSYMASTPILSQGYDGLEYWDLDDFDAQLKEPLDDPFGIVVRATNLRRFSYQTEIVTDPDERNAYRSVDLERGAGPNPNLWTSIMRVASTKPLVNFGLPKPYRIEQLVVDYGGPPDRLGFTFADLQQLPKRTLRVTYNGSRAGNELRFYNSFGGSSGSFADATLAGVPGGGTPEAPDIDICIAANNMNCSPVDYASTNSFDEFSASALFSAPVNIDLEYFQNSDRQIYMTDLDVAKGITISHETVDEGTFDVESHRVWVDTAGGTVDGAIRVTQRNAVSGNLDTWIRAVLPVGFYADGRYVDIEVEGVGFHEGFMNCPAGTVITADSWGIDFDLTDDLCGS